MAHTNLKNSRYFGKNLAVFRYKDSNHLRKSQERGAVS